MRPLDQAPGARPGRKAARAALGRRPPRRTGRLAFVLVAVGGMLAAVAGFASAQIPTTPPPAPNPPLTAACGLKVALVLDESASIPAGGHVAEVRAAANGFVNALEGTGSQLAITAFSVTGRPGVPVPAQNGGSGYQTVTPTSAGIFHAWINGPTGSPSNPTGFNPVNGPPNLGTNWQDGFNQVLRTPGGPPELVVFVTDGLPNYWMGASGTTPTLVMPDGNLTVMNAATSAANNVKALGSRIFAIGVGTATQGGDAAERLKNISGDRNFTNGSGFADSDFAAVDFDHLQDALTSVVASLCGSRLIITKRILDHTGEFTPASGWRFDTTLTPAGGHTWLSPAGIGTVAGASLTTGANGMVDFHWNLHQGEHSVHVGITHEHAEDHPGFHFVSASCDTHIGGEIHTVASVTEIPSAGALELGHFRTCEVFNRPEAARLTVVKHLVPSTDPGRFNLLINGVEHLSHAGNLGSTGPVVLPLGTHTVSETAAPGTDLDDYDSRISCVDVADHDRVVAHGTGTSLHVDLHNQAEDIVCTITNVSTTHGQLTVIKHLIPAGDHGRFDLLVDGDVHAHDVGDGGRAGPLRLPFGTYHVTEQGAGGTSLGDYQISTTCIDQGTGQTVADNAHGPAVTVSLSHSSNYIACTISNRRPGVETARLKVVKHLIPHDDAGLFDLLVGGTAFAVAVGHNGTTGPLEFELGTHTITEHAVGGTRLSDFSISTICVDHGHTVASNAHGPSVAVDLNNESDDVVCTITNRRGVAPGTGGGGGVVPAPPAPTPLLSLTKTVPAHAQVNELVPITIVVHNHGHGSAHRVTVVDTPPDGLRIVKVEDHGTIPHDGRAFWHLGTVAPGETRTVHATARVDDPGVHVNDAVAIPGNGDPAVSVAAVTAVPAPGHGGRPGGPGGPTPPPPRVTG